MTAGARAGVQVLKRLCRRAGQAVGGTTDPTIGTLRMGSTRVGLVDPGPIPAAGRGFARKSHKTIAVAVSEPARPEPVESSAHSRTPKASKHRRNPGIANPPLVSIISTSSRAGSTINIRCPKHQVAALPSLEVREGGRTNKTSPESCRSRGNTNQQTSPKPMIRTSDAASPAHGHPERRSTVPSGGHVYGCQVVGPSRSLLTVRCTME